ncbi:MAG TPA: peroxiredoxin [Steroidobacteraceae bacterium]|jgi:peroxiredoxin|nr:peroxiredoxin [Steroidobacteraceae bacterium]
MKRFLVSAIAAGVITVPAFAAIQQGAKAPDFKTQASLAGKEFSFSLKDALKKGPVVVYFYPAAYTGGCNIQAHTFAENMDKFSAAGASVIGVSLDKISTLNQFSADPDYCAGKLPVASDADGSIAKSYELKVGDARPGAKNTKGQDIDHGFAERTTFIVTPDGKVAATVGGVKPDENVLKALETVQQLSGKKPNA